MSDIIPKGTYKVKRESAWIGRKGFDYVVKQKFSITEGPFKGRRLVLSYSLEDVDVMELNEDAPP